MSITEVRQWVSDHFLPAVMVAATPAAENICLSRNGLSIVDILRPHSNVSQLNGAQTHSPAEYALFVAE